MRWNSYAIAIGLLLPPILFPHSIIAGGAEEREITVGVFPICGTVSNYRPGKSLYMALYDSNDHFKQKQLYRKLRILKDKLPADSVEFCLPEVPPGDYMLVCFQDLNDNAQLEIGLFGRPSEPYCFYRSYTGIFCPSFDDCKFTVSGPFAGANLHFTGKKK